MSISTNLPPSSTEATDGSALHPLSASPRPRRRASRWPLVVAVFAILIALAAWSSNRFSASSENGVQFQTHEVYRSDLEIAVVEQGNLESMSNLDIRCEVEGGRVGSGSSGGGTQIIWLFKEGEFVEKGEKLVELDPSGLKQQEIEQQIAYENARQALITAKNTFEASNIAVDEYQLGTYPKELQTVEAEVTVAKEGLRRAEEYAKYSEGLYRKGFVTKPSLEADLFAVENAQLTLAAAETKKQALVEYTRKKTVADLESARDSAEAAMKAAEAKFSLEQSKLDQIRDQLEKCTIVAPQNGMVIYASDRDRRGRSEGNEIKEGALVRLRQVIIQLPDLKQMQVKAKVHESMIERVKKGQKVNVKIDALPHLDLHGEVSGINNQPEPGSWFSSNVKEYAVFITIDETVENLKPGMTAEVEILVDHLTDVLTVPVQSVVQKGSEFFCYLATDSGIERRLVTLGASNDVYIEIKDGLNEGDRVILHPRSVVPDARQRIPEDDEAKSNDSKEKESKVGSASDPSFDEKSKNAPQPRNDAKSKS